MRRPFIGGLGYLDSCLFLSLARSGATPVGLRPSRDGCGAIGAGLLKRNPLALQRTGRVAGLEPHARERYEVPNGKSNDSFGHDVLLPAHASSRAGGPINRAAPKAQVGRTFVSGGVGRAAGRSRIPDGFCSLTQTGSRTVRSGQGELGES
jgi:hypothetical protein